MLKISTTQVALSKYVFIKIRNTAQYKVPNKSDAQTAGYLSELTTGVFEDSFRMFLPQNQHNSM